MSDSPLARFLGWVPFVVSAALVAASIDLSIRRPLLGLVLAELALALTLPQILARRRLRRVLRSGDVDAVLHAWEASVERMPHPETMAPLITATALAASGRVERARKMLERARRGPVWEAAIEQRLVIDTLLSVFDGEPDHALESAAVLERLPLPPSPLLRSRVQSLRYAMGAFARAFAHRSARTDLATLKSASRRNPLVYWAMRYAAAVVSIDLGTPDEARRLLASAPAWPGDSAFASFHEQIERKLAEG